MHQDKIEYPEKLLKITRDRVQLQITIVLNGISVGNSKVEFNNSPCAYFQDIQIFTGYREQGVGDKLLKRVIEKCRERKKRIIGCDVIVYDYGNEEEAVAQAKLEAWYLKRGFRNNNTYFPEQYGKWVFSLCETMPIR